MTFRHSGAHEYRLIEIHLQFHALGRRGLDVRQHGFHRVDDRERGSAAVLEDRQEAGALAIDANDIGLLRKTVADLGDVPEQHRNPLPNSDRKGLKLVDQPRAGIELNVVFLRSEARDARRHDHVRDAHRVHDVHLRQALGAGLGGIDLDDDLTLLAAEGARNRQTRDREQPQPEELIGVVGQHLLRQRLGVERDLHHRHVRRVELDDVRRLHARRRDAQHRVALRRDLRDGAADIGALLEIDLDDALPGDRQRFDVIDAVDGGRIGALADEHDAPLHVLGIEAVEAPRDVDDRNVDVREDVDHHAADGDEPHQHDEHGGDGHRVRPPQRNLHEIDHAQISSVGPGRVVGPWPCRDRSMAAERCQNRLSLLGHNPARSISRTFAAFLRRYGSQIFVSPLAARINFP